MLANSFLVLLLSAGALAVPAPQRLNKRAFSVQARSLPHLNGLEALAQAYRKYGWEASDDSFSPFAALEALNGLLSPVIPGLGSTQRPGVAAAPATPAFAQAAAAPAVAPASVPADPVVAAQEAPSTSATASAPSSASTGVRTGSKAGATTADGPDGGAVTTSKAPTSGGAQSGSVPTKGEDNDVEFLAPVTIGGQSFFLNFDTGSADLWVYSTKQPESQFTGHSVYDPSKSSTYTEIPGATWNITYGDGSGASGVVGLDVVNIGGAEVRSQAVELATTVSAAFTSDVNSDGLVGLAYSNLNTVKPNKVKSFWENVLPDLEQPLFTAALRHSGTGTYNFGYIDQKQYSGSLTTVSVLQDSGFWEFAASDVIVQGQTTTVAGGKFVVDTGTTLLLLSPQLTDAYWSKVKSAEKSPTLGQIFDCNEQLPDFGLRISGSYVATVPGPLMNYAPAGNGKCFGGIQSSGGDLMILGDIFLKAQFVVFNGGEHTLSFAPIVA